MSISENAGIIDPAIFAIVLPEPVLHSKIATAFITTKLQGTGLGLAICRMIIQYHGGQLTASSDGKSGASFQFVLPIRSTDRAATRVE